MTNADPRTLASVLSFLERQNLNHAETEEQYSTKVEVRSGASRATVTVFNTGSIVVGGRDSPLKNLLQEIRKGIEAGGPGPGQFLPFEIDKFPDIIRERVEGCDPVIVRFVEEAIKCVKADALLAAAFMIGAVSERAISLLIGTYADAIRGEKNRDRFRQRIDNHPISTKYEEFLMSYRGVKTRPSDPLLSQDLDVVIETMFQFCRITRNEIGHPQIVPDLDRGVLLANLGHLVTYIERIYALMRFFSKNGVEV